MSELADAQQLISDLVKSADEYKQEKEKWVNSKKKYSATVNSIADALHVVDTDLRILLMNKAFKDWTKKLGLDSEVEGKTIFEVFPFLPKKIQKEYDKVFSTGDILITEETTTVNEQELITETRKIPIFEDGIITQVITIIRDITERKQAEDALKESEERFKAQYHGSPTPTFTWQKRGDDFVLVDYNNAAAVINNGDVAQYIGKTAHEMYEHQQDVLEDLGRCFEEKTIIRKELQSKHFLPGRLIITTYVFVPNDLVMVHIEDITDRKLAEEALRKSEERYRTIFENTGSASILMGEDTTILLANSKFQQLSGYSRQEIEGKMSWTSFVDKEDLERMRQYHELRRKESKSVPGSYEFRSINRKGEKRNIILNVALIPETNESIASLIDITERKKMEESLQQNEAKYRFLTEKMNDLIWTANLDFNLTYISPSVKKILGFTPEERIQQTPAEMMTPEALSHAFTVLNRELEREYEEGVDPERTVKLELDFYHKNGSLVCMENVMSAIRGHDGKITGIHGVSRDITERKKAEESRHQREAYFSAIIENQPGLVWLKDTESRFLAVNHAFAISCGKQRGEDLIGKTDLDIWPMELAEKYRRDDLTIMKTGKPIIIEEPIYDKGEIRWFETFKTPVLDEQRTIIGTTGYARDITERKQAEEEKKKLETQLAQAQKLESIGTLAGGIAHDFNNILSAIIGYTQLAMDDVSEPLKARKELKEVLKASDRAKDLVSQILTFSRKTDARYSPISLHKTVMDTIKMMRSVLPTTIDIRQDLLDHGMVMADPTQIHQVMLNLCTNAAHAMDKTGGVMEVRLRRLNIDEGTQSPEPNLPLGSYLRLSVSDTGHGMSPEVMARIFDPYFTTKEIGKGTGLGLAVVHGIVQSHGGTITCTSTPGKGTTFDIYLPEILSEEVVVRHHEEKSLPMGTERILFVDDEPILVELAKKMLSKLGYTVVTRSSSFEALELFQKDPDRYDLVITDMTMPGITGDKLAQKFMEIRHDIPIILCSGYSEYISEDKAKKIGIREFVMKPLEMNELARTIRKVLDGE